MAVFLALLSFPGVFLRGGGVKLPIDNELLKTNLEVGLYMQIYRKHVYINKSNFS